MSVTGEELGRWLVASGLAEKRRGEEVAAALLSRFEIRPRDEEEPVILRWDPSAPPPTREVAEARVKVAELREALRGIELRSPGYPAGEGPTAEDACERLLETIGYCLDQVERFVG